MNCCCQWGAAVSREQPEFPCDECPMHPDAIMRDGHRCKRHTKEKNS